MKVSVCVVQCSVSTFVGVFRENGYKWKTVHKEKAIYRSRVQALPVEFNG